MRKILVVIILLFFCKTGTAQVWFSTHANILLVNADSVWLEYGAYFQWGPGGPVDWLQGYAVDNQNDTLYLKLYYSYPGVAIMGGSVTLDTITVKPLPATADYLSISSYWVSAAQDTTKNKDAFDTTIALIPTAVADVQQQGRLNLYPNPVHDQLSISDPDGALLHEILIFNFCGMLVKRDSCHGTIDLTSIVPGIYTVLACTERGTLKAIFLKE
ncbi:MAG: T9SS type A sorting domain-containing protein [Chitinophagaceae bacterium]|nr:T9SS type A sorting domain-containing protein [Chitinophagaceae bacterium]